MKITAHHIGPSISLKPENEAERHQLEELAKKLVETRADWCEWSHRNPPVIHIKLQRKESHGPKK